jgi:hypothetical protein
MGTGPRGNLGLLNFLATQFLIQSSRFLAVVLLLLPSSFLHITTTIKRVHIKFRHFAKT